jgi:hypothetical protein
MSENLENADKEQVLVGKYESVVEEIIGKRSRMADFLNQQKRTMEKKSQFLIAYEKSMGNVSMACQYAGIKSRKTFYNWCNSDPEFKAAVHDVISSQYDYIQDLMMMRISKGDPIFVRWYLSHRHPDYMQKRNSRPTQKGYNSLMTYDKNWRTNDDD